MTESPYIDPYVSGRYHDVNDQDSSDFAGHHSLGTDGFQASPGNHKHLLGTTLTGIQNGGPALASVVAALVGMGATDQTTVGTVARGRIASSIWAPGVDPSTAFTAVTDVTGLAAITWTPDATRMYRLSVRGMTTQVTNAGNQTLYITDNSNTVITQTNQTGAVGDFISWNLQYLLSGVGTSLTYKVRISSSAASGNLRALTTYPWHFLVEDIGT